MKRLKYISFAMLAMFALLFHFGSSNLLLKPTKRTPDVGKVQRMVSSRGLEYHPLEFSSDGTQLSGYFAEQGEFSDKTVVMLHGVGGVSTDLTKELDLFLNQGYNVAAIDARAHGNSGGNHCTYGFHEVKDYSTLLDQLEAKYSQTQFAIYGHSMGAAVAIQCASKESRFRSLVAFAPFSSLEEVSLEYMGRLFGVQSTLLNSWMLFAAESRADFDVDQVSPILSAQNLKCSTAIVHGENDIHIPLSHSEEIYSAIGHAQKVFLPIPQANHVSLWSSGGGVLESEVLKVIEAGWE